MSAPLFSRTDRSIWGQWWWTVDRSMLTAVMALIVFGIVLVAAASPPVAERIGLDQFHFIKRHLVYLVPSLVLLFGLSLLELKTLRRFSVIVFGLSLISMILVLFIGMEIKGAQRWLHLPGFSLQPSEFIKPAFAVVSAWFMAKQKSEPDFPGNKIAAGLFLIVVSLLLLQPDLGMTVIVTSIYGAQIFLAGFPFIWLMIFGIAAIALLFTSYFVFDHVKSRIDRFLDPDSGDNYQVGKALEAFKEGGLIGVGPGQGEVKLSLPDSHSDFIFAVAGEELGLFFVVIIISLFGFILLRGLNRVMDSNDMFVILATGGLLTMFALQAFIHMGSSVSLIPTKGMTLPFISYGGSSLLAIGMAMGMVLSLTRRRARKKIYKKAKKSKSR
jgi:cell division protein FtsW